MIIYVNFFFILPQSLKWKLLFTTTQHSRNFDLCTYLKIEFLSQMALKCVILSTALICIAKVVGWCTPSTFISLYIYMHSALHKMDGRHSHNLLNYISHHNGKTLKAKCLGGMIYTFKSVSQKHFSELHKDF